MFLDGGLIFLALPSAQTGAVVLQNQLDIPALVRHVLQDRPAV
jgi:hypothetical protein